MNAIVLGGASCLWRDMDEMANLAPSVPWGPEIARDVRWVVLAVNDAIAAYAGPLHAAVTLHPEKLNGWLRVRQENGFPAPGMLWSHRDGDPPAEHTLPIRHNLSGSSGLFAVQVAQDHFNADRIVLCGVPMDGSPHFDGPAWADYGKFLDAWLRWIERGELNNVRSMSGWTKDMLGSPPAAWVAGEVPVCPVGILNGGES